MTEETKNLGMWIVAAVLVALVCFEEVRFGRRHLDRPSSPAQQVETEKSPAEVAPAISADSPSTSQTAVKIAESSRTGPDS